VYSLMPWMHKYRLEPRPKEEISPSARKALEFVDLHRDYANPEDFSTELVEEKSQDLLPAAPRQSILGMATMAASRRCLLQMGQEEDNDLQTKAERLEVTVKELKEQVEKLQEELRQANAKKHFVVDDALNLANSEGDDDAPVNEDFSKDDASGGGTVD
jgi:hypothetical protein